MKIDLNEIQKRIDSGYIKVQKHPEEDLFIYNYTNKAQYDRAWDSYTTICRGLILDSKGSIKARPFKKFFNLGENGMTPESLPDLRPKIFEKMDGSLGILYRDKYGEIYIATRGSFESDQAKWATTWLRRQGYSKTDFLPDFTYIFEIIYPQNRIVVDYGPREDLTLLSVIHTMTGSEIGFQEEAKRLKLNTPKFYDMSLKDAAHIASEELDGNHEGYVAVYPNGLRVKIKGEEYLKLHKARFGTTNKVIWETLKDGESIKELLEYAPDEVIPWIKSIANDIKFHYDDIMGQAELIKDTALGAMDRKSQAEYICKSPREIQGVAFALLDNKIDRARELAWKQVKPGFESFPGDLS